MAARLVGNADERRGLKLARQLGISEKRLYGWEPRVNSYDTDGNLTGWTQAEVEWDDMQRARMFALLQYEAELCPCGCGWHTSLTDGSQEFQLNETACEVGQALTETYRERDDLDDRARKAHGKSEAPLSLPSDGKAISVSLMGPASTPLGDPSKSKSKKAGGRSNGNA